VDGEHGGNGEQHSQHRFSPLKSHSHGVAFQRAGLPVRTAAARSSRDNRIAWLSRRDWIGLNPMMRRRDALLLAMTAAVAPPWPAFAQEQYPSRPIRLVIPSVPAGVHDVIGRLWAERVKPILGTIVIDNRGGGGGVIGANDVAHSKPDGYSILLGSTSTQVLSPAAMAQPPYDPVKSFAGVSVFSFSSTSIVVNPALPVHSLQELIAYAKTNPGKLSYGSAGNGSITNMADELFKRLAGGLDIVHIPYKGIGQGVTDLISGTIPMFSANATAQILDLARAGKVRILSVNSSERIKAATDIPTSIEAGLPGMVAQRPRLLSWRRPARRRHSSPASTPRRSG